jgi:hypothetical protein
VREKVWTAWQRNRRTQLQNAMYADDRSE